MNETRRGFFGRLFAAVAIRLGLKSGKAIAAPTCTIKSEDLSKLSRFHKEHKRRLRIYEAGANVSHDDALAWCIRTAPEFALVVAESTHGYFDRDVIRFKVRHFSFDVVTEAALIPSVYQFSARCQKCTFESPEPPTASTRPWKWPCPHCGGDLMQQHDEFGGALVPPSLSQAIYGYHLSPCDPSGNPLLGKLSSG